MKHNDHAQGQNGHAGHSGVDLIKLLVADGYVQKLGWFQLGDAGEDVQEEDKEDAAATEKPLSPEAERKRTQRKADKAAGWAQCHARAPDDADARELVSLVATGIIDPAFRAAIWIAVRNRHIVNLGARVLRLTGVRRLIMRLIIGSFETRANL
jgi:hypothetical protein